MKEISLLCVFLAVLFKVNSQIAKNQSDPVIKVIAQYSAFADSLYYSGKLDSAAIYYLKSADYAQKSGKGYFKETAEGFGNAGYCFLEQDYFISAISYFEKALKYSELSNNLVEIATNHSNIGIAEIMLSNYTSALDHFTKALDIDEKSGNKKNISTDFNNIGKLYETWKDYNLAKTYYKKALEKDILNQDTDKMAIRLNNIGMVFNLQNQSDSALFYLKKALEIDEKSKNQKKIATRLSNIGTILSKSGKYVEADHYLQKSYRYFLDNKVIKSVCIVENAMANNYFLMGNYLKAEELYKESLKKSREIKFVSQVIENSKDLSNLYKTLNNCEQSYKYFKIFSQLNDSVFNNNSQKLIKEYHIKYETERKEKDIHLKQLELEKSEFQKYIFAGIAIFLFLIAGFLINIITLRRKTAKILKEKNEQLSESNNTKDKFFSIIAHDLRTPLAGLRNLSQGLISNLEKYSLDELKLGLFEINQSSNDIRNLLVNLLEWSKTQQNKIKIKTEKLILVEVIDAVTSELVQQLKDKDIVINKIFDSNSEIEADLNILSTTLRNLISNAVKFSNPKSVIDVNFLSDRDHYIIKIIDNGIGMTSADLQKLFRIDCDTNSIGNSPEKGSGLGLILSMELVKLHKGRIHAESILSKGSTFTVFIPLNYIDEKI